MPFCSQGVISPARRSAKAEVRGANPRGSATPICDFRFTIDEFIRGVTSRQIRKSSFTNRKFLAPVPQQLQERFRKPLFVGANPTGGPSLRSGFRLGVPIFQGRDVIVSISACDADCAGANPVALTIFNFDGPKVAGYRANTKGVVAHRERAARRKSGAAGSSPACEAPSCGTTCPSTLSIDSRCCHWLKTASAKHTTMRVFCWINP